MEVTLEWAITPAYHGFVKLGLLVYAMCSVLYANATSCTQAMNLDTFDRSFGIAEAQAGYFTTAQAKSVGGDRAQLSRYVTAGKLERVRQGVYRLKPLPHVPHEDLFIAWLAA